MANAPVFGRRGTSERPLPTLAQLAPSEPNAEADELAAWKAARKEDRRQRYWRSFLGWRGAALILMLSGIGLQLADLPLLAAVPMFFGVACGVMSVRRGEP